MGDTGASGVIGFFIIIALFVCAIGLLAVFLIGLARGFGRHSKTAATVAGVLLLPALLLCVPIAYQLVKHQVARSIEDKKSRPIVLAFMGEDLNSLMNQFLVEHPLSVTFPNNDETPYSPELMEYLATNDVFQRSGFSIKDGSLYSPYGDAILLAFDKNNDGLIVTNRCVVANPWRNKQYSCVLIRHAAIQEANSNHKEWKRLN